MSAVIRTTHARRPYRTAWRLAAAAAFVQHALFAGLLVIVTSSTTTLLSLNPPLGGQSL